MKSFQVYNVLLYLQLNGLTDNPTKSTINKNKQFVRLLQEEQAPSGLTVCKFSKRRTWEGRKCL